MTRPFYEPIRWYLAICNRAYFFKYFLKKILNNTGYPIITWYVHILLRIKKNVFIRTKIPFPFRAIRYFSSFFMTNIIRFLQATRDFLKIHICDQTNFLSATLNGWNIVIHTTLLMVLLYIVLYKKHTKSANKAAGSFVLLDYLNCL